MYKVHLWRLSIPAAGKWWGESEMGLALSGFLSDGGGQGINLTSKKTTNPAPDFKYSLKYVTLV